MEPGSYSGNSWVNHVRAGQEVFESEVVQSGFRKTREPAGVLSQNYLVEFTKSTSPGLKVVAKDIPIANAALTVTANRQQDGYGYLLVP